MGAADHDFTLLNSCVAGATSKVFYFRPIHRASLHGGLDESGHDIGLWCVGQLDDLVSHGGIHIGELACAVSMCNAVFQQHEVVFVGRVHCCLQVIKSDGHNLFDRWLGDEVGDVTQKRKHEIAND